MSAPMPAAWGKKKSLKKLRKARKKAKAVLPLRKVVVRKPKPKKKITSNREISVSVPAAKQRTYIARKPRINGGRSFVVSHREWLQPITTVTAFTGAGRYVIQPGLADNFPWLAQLAANFENYRFRSCKYVYRNRISTSGNQSIYMATQYDVSDPEFQSIEEIMNYGGAKEEVAWRDWTYSIKPRRGQLSRKYMIRTDTLPSGLDPTLYDTALYTICAISSTADTYVGDLMVEYEVEFTNPKMNPNLVSAAGAFAYGTAASMAGLAASPFSGMNFSAGSSLGDMKGFSSDNAPVLDAKTTPTTPSITFPVPGAYHISYTVEDPGGSGTVTGSNFTVSPSDSGSLFSSFSTYASAAGKGMQQFCDVITTKPLAKVVMGSLATSGTASGAFFTTVQVTCESLNYMLASFGSAPDPPLKEEEYVNLIKAFPKHDLSKIRAKLETFRRKREFKDILNERRSELPILQVRRSEVQLERAENSDEEVVEMPQSRSRSVDKRSKSSDRKQDDR